MITFLAKVVNVLAIILQNFVVFASTVGETIVKVITIIFTITFNTIKGVLLFFQIVYEDNISIFTEDLPNLMYNLNNAIYYQWSYVLNSLLTMSNEVTFKLDLITTNFKWLISAVFLVICEVLTYLKKTVTFFGETLWLMFTFVPVHLPGLVKIFLRYTKEFIVNNIIDAYMALLRITNFLSDVPLESFMGIMTSIILIRSFIYFRETIHIQFINFYWTLVRKVTYLYHTIHHYFTNSEVRTITQIIGGQEMVPRNVDIHLMDNSDHINAADALCVICQERQKCVLTLPCRHVCLCSECCMRLYGYQRKCPICRTFIYHSVTVYL